MSDQRSRGLLRRVACGTVAATGILGALALSTGPTGPADVVARPATVAVVAPMQPPVPPGPPVPPPMQEPGQEGPDSSQHGTPPPPPGGPFDSCADVVVVGGYPVLNTDKPSRCHEA